MRLEQNAQKKSGRESLDISNTKTILQSGTEKDLYFILVPHEVNRDFIVQQENNLLYQHDFSSRNAMFM